MAKMTHGQSLWLKQITATHRAAKNSAGIIIDELWRCYGVVICAEAQRDRRRGDNLKAAGLRLSDSEIAALDAATALPPVYPNWFIERLADQPTAQAIGRTRP